MGGSRTRTTTRTRGEDEFHSEDHEPLNPHRPDGPRGETSTVEEMALAAAQQRPDDDPNDVRALYGLEPLGEDELELWLDGESAGAA